MRSPPSPQVVPDARRLVPAPLRACGGLLLVGWVLGARLAVADESPATGGDPFVVTLSGGVSLGTYQAGQAWALLSYLRAARDGRLAADAPLAGRHPVLVGVTGASAGGINALASAVTWCRDGADKVDDNLLRSLWIDVDLDDLLPEDGRAYEPGDGLLSRAAFRQPVERLVAALAEPSFMPGCRLPVALTTTRVTPTRVRVGGLKVSGQRAVVPLRFEVGADGLPRTEAQRLPPTAPRIGELLYLTRQAGGVSPRQVATALQASSAVPVVFSPVQLEFCASSCPVELDTPALGTCAHLPDRPVPCRGNFVDGGIFDNVPLGLARVLAEAWLERGRDRVDERPVTYYYIEPDNRRSAPNRIAPALTPLGRQRAFPDHLQLGSDLVASAGRSALLETVLGNRWNRDVGDLAWSVADLLAPEPPLIGPARAGRARALLECLDPEGPRTRARPCAEALGQAVLPGDVRPPGLDDLRRLAARTRALVAAPYDDAFWRARLRAEGGDPALAESAFRRVTARTLRLLGADLTWRRHDPRVDLAALGRALRDVLYVVHDVLRWSTMLAADPAVAREVARLQAEAEALQADVDTAGEGRAGRRVRLTTRLAPVVGDALFNFAAFLDQPLRRFDYAAGVYDGARFLAEQACVEGDPYAVAPAAMDPAAPFDTLDHVDGRSVTCLGTATGQVLRTLGVLDAPYEGRVARALGRWEGADSPGWAWAGASADRGRVPPGDVQALKVLAAMVPGLDACASSGAIGVGEVDFTHLARRLECLGYQPGSRAMERACADPEGWWNDPMVRLLGRALRVERAERDAASSGSDAREALEGSVTAIEAANYAVRRYVDAPATFGFGTTSAPTATLLTALLPYGLDFDLSRGGVGIRYEAWWRPTRPVSVRLLASPLRFRRDDSWSALTLAVAGHLRSPALRTFGIGPAVFFNWDHPEDAPWSLGAEAYASLIVGILRVGGGYRRLPAGSGGDTFFLNLGVSDFNALMRLVWLL